MLRLASAGFVESAIVFGGYCVMESGSATARAAPAQAAAEKAAGGHAWASHPVDLRFSMRLPFGRYYLALVAGPERREPERLSTERQRRRMTTLGNFLFFCVTAVAINAVALMGLLIYSAVLRF